jgi:hypothetical protein
MRGGITIYIPDLPVVEVVLMVIAILLFRILHAVQEAVQLLRDMNSDKESYEPPSEKSRRSPQLSRKSRYSTDSGPTGSEGTRRNGTSGEKSSTPDRSWSIEQPARPIKTSASHFAKCLLSEADVDVALFIAACEHLASKVLPLVGPFTLLSIREVHSNMKKIEHSFELAPLRYRSMRELLNAETAAGMHQPGGLIVDPSAAMGLLWARRGLQFWIFIFRELVAQHGLRVSVSNAQPELGGMSESSSSRDDRLDNLKEIVERSYAASLQPYFGWLSNNSMSLALRAVPAEFPVLAPTLIELLEDLQEWADVVEQLIERMAATQQELDLEDKRKSI